MFKTSLFILFVVTMNAARAVTTKNLTAITWSHATNSQKLLNEVLASDINFIEADIVYGYLINDTERILLPIMAHPPANESDISLKSFLTQIWAFNDARSSAQQKGVKLDFKSTDVFQVSLDILREMWNDNYEIWINADVYSGPLENTATQPVNATIFFQESKKFANATLSSGWTTRWGPDFTVGSYTTEQVTNMINGIKNNQVSNPITFPVRAGIAAQSIESLSFLYESLNSTNYVTFTIWSSQNDSVNVENLRKMIFHFGLDKIYIDVPEDLHNQLRLDDPPNGTSSIFKSFGLGLMLVLGAIIMMF
ncbi:hypothetical protein PVAND_001466 [Polypedilum vanderplanki]|uniref:Menorin-like domain-containing protein n=1 Tax=Polypedilum vanderplanki TaxID=319348 RepID=A0A9J6BNA3_POLVA|nr:hypothetical protein PVAND_001466 [Polypedilum vanderplanki]